MENIKVVPLSEMTEDFYTDLFFGEIRYYITSLKRVGFGVKNPWWKVFLHNLMHRHTKLSYDYPNYYTDYQVATAVSGKGMGIHLSWDKSDMEAFAKATSLQIGDKVTVYFLAPNSRGGHWCAGGYTYLVGKDGWKVIDKIRGL